ncbi:peroxiredoxin [Pseudoalteromonas ruthenica]|uniref:peroxiredoxin n=1 Tax=Pseudoalteromonas ruthenica TaxID=151081 RepID=UPI00241F3BED|nr:peroxiredoxin [Pseudoalteromonas ruthenica]|tara:strand:- start:48418 stop:48891 length:474 start_codon:yes stop_codon:yes gene_type:complete
MIAQGQALPSATFSLLDEQGMTHPSTEQLFAGKKVVLFAVPGAFTPTCSAKHLPGFIAHQAQFSSKGVDNIICLSVNDAFVMKAWGEHQGAQGVTMLADGDASFTKAIGLDKDTAGFGGIRSKRYAMVVDDGVVTQLFVEQDKQFGVSSAEQVLANL